MNIFVAIQDRLLLESLVRYLKNKGHNVDSAFDGVITCNELQLHHNILFVDEEIPRLTYEEVIRFAKKINPDMRFILLINNDVKTKLLLNNSMVDEFVPKPFTFKSVDLIMNNFEIKKEENFTFKEQLIYQKIVKNRIIEYQKIKEIIRKEEIEQYRKAIQIKKKIQIEYTERGLEYVQEIKN